MTARVDPADTTPLEQVVQFILAPRGDWSVGDEHDLAAAIAALLMQTIAEASPTVVHLDGVERTQLLSRINTMETRIEALEQLLHAQIEVNRSRSGLREMLVASIAVLDRESPR